MGRIRSLLPLLMILTVPAMADAAKYAVLVGVESYQHAKLRTPKLKYAVDDAVALGKILADAGYDVTLLTDEAKEPGLKPTGKNIEAHLKTVLRKCGAQDTVVLAFAGHGLQFAGQKDAFFCPSDARPFADETATLVSINGIYSELDKSFAGVKLILIDACRNDPTPGRGRGVDADSAPPPPRGVAALFSCSAGEKAFEHDDLQHGVFFHHVLQGLQGKAADRNGEVTFEALSTHVRRNVHGTMKQLFPGTEQSPNLKADLRGVPPVLVKVAVSERRPEPRPNPRSQGPTSWSARRPETCATTMA